MLEHLDRLQQPGVEVWTGGKWSFSSTPSQSSLGLHGTASMASISSDVHLTCPYYATLRLANGTDGGVNVITWSVGECVRVCMTE